MALNTQFRIDRLTSVRVFPQLCAAIFASLFSLGTMAATVTGELTIVASQLQLVAGGAGGVDFGNSVTPADGILDSDASPGAAFTLVAGFGDFPIIFGDAPAASFYDFSLAGVINASNLVLTYGDFIVEYAGTSISTTSTSGGAITPVDFIGQGILTSATAAFDATEVSWLFGATGLNGGEITIFANGVPAVGNPVPVPAAVWFFTTALAGLFSVKRLRA